MLRRISSTCQLITFTILILFSASAVASTIRIPTDQPTIQAGIDVALTSDTVLVTPGTYSGPGNEAIRFNGKGIYLTSESGAEACTLLTIDTVRTVIFDSGEDSMAVLNGFTISGGYESSFDWSDPYRGGIYCDSASPILRNCVITGCYALDGGGALVEGSGSPRFDSCQIIDNYARETGGGIAGWSDSLFISNSTISGNTVDSLWGGGLFIVTEKCELVNSRIERNKVPLGDEDPTGIQLSFGAGIAAFLGELVVDSCNVAHNSGYAGSAIYSLQAGVTLTNSIIFNNTACFNPGVYIRRSEAYDRGFGIIDHCVFVCNYSAYDVRKVNYLSDFARGDEVVSWIDILRAKTNLPTRSLQATLDSPSSLTNSNIAFNSCQAVDIGDDRGVEVSHNNLWHQVCAESYGGLMAGQVGTAGNISADPLFCDISSQGLSLDVSSPCLGTGTNGTDMGVGGTGCSNYASRPPMKIVVRGTDVYDQRSSNDSVKSALARTIPWDTLYFESHFYRYLEPIVINKPLYIEGQGGNYTVLESLLQGNDILLDVSSFCVISKLHAATYTLYSQDLSRALMVRSGSPIVWACLLAAPQITWPSFSSGAIIEIESSSPLVRHCFIPVMPYGFSAITKGNENVIASNNYWEVHELAWVMHDFYDDPALGIIAYKPTLYENPTDVTYEYDPTLPDKFTLSQNYPNPFNPSTTIEFELPKPGQVELEVFNVLGQTVAILVDKFLPAGQHRIVWNGASLASGIYLYRLNTESNSEIRKMVLVK